MWYFLTSILLGLLSSGKGQPTFTPCAVPTPMPSVAQRAYTPERAKSKRPWVARIVAAEETLRTQWFDALTKDNRKQIEKMWAWDEHLSYLYYVRDPDGCSAFEWSMYHNNTKLFSHITDYSRSPCYHLCPTHRWLHHVVKQHNPDMLIYLVETCHVDLDAKDAEGKVALDYAWEIDWPEAACFLASEEASVEAGNARQLLYWALFQNDTELMRVLLPSAQQRSVIQAIQYLVVAPERYESAQGKALYGMLVARAQENAQKRVGDRLLYWGQSGVFYTVQAGGYVFDTFGVGDHFSYIGRLFCGLGLMFTLSSSGWIFMCCVWWHKARYRRMQTQMYTTGTWVVGEWQDVCMVETERAHRSALTSLPGVTLPPEIIDTIISYLVVAPKRDASSQGAWMYRLFCRLAQSKQRLAYLRRKLLSQPIL